MKNIIDETKRAVIVIALFLALILIICIFFIAFGAVTITEFVTFTNVLNNLTTPLLTFTAILLTFLAFYIQKKANDDLKDELKNQKETSINDFNFQSIKDSVMMLNDDINNFNVSFVGNKLVTSMENICGSEKKYNFIGVQGISLFLYQYYKEKNQNYDLTLEEIKDLAAHANYIQIANTIHQFANIYRSGQLTKMTEDQEYELYELIDYVYLTKLNYIVDIIRRNNPDEKLSRIVNDLYLIYNEKNS